MRRFCLIALCSTAALALTAPLPAAAQSTGVSALLEQARYWEERGRHDRAVQTYRRVLEIDPDNVEARRGLRGPAPAPTPAPSPAPQPAPQGNAPAPAAAPRRPAPEQPQAPRAPTASEQAGRDRAAGFQALEAGRLTDAARAFDSALARAPNDADSLGGLGLVRLRQNRFADARDLLRRASQRGSASRWAEALASADFFATLGDARAAFDRGELDSARQMAERLAGSGYQDSAPALDLLAAVYEKQGRYQDAATVSRKAAQQAGTTAEARRRYEVNALRQQALAARQNGDESGAELLFQQGMLADPADPWIRYEYGRFLMDRGRVAEVDSLIQNLALKGGAEPLYAAALLLDRLGRPGEAQQMMARIPRDQTSAEMTEFVAGLQVDTAVDRARNLAAGGQTQQAVAGLRQIAATPGLGAGSLAEIASALYELGDTAGAGDFARQALDRNPGDAESYEPIIRVLAQTGQEAFALSALQRVNEAVGDTPEGAQMVARLNGTITAVQADQLREAGRYAESFDLLQSAWNRAPGNVEILAALARLYQSGGLSLQASQTFQMVLQKRPDDQGALIGLIDSASAAGDRQLAQQALEKAIRAHPDAHEVYLAGARFRRASGDERGARAMLERAREVYLAKSGLAAGGFPAANPFSHMPAPAAGGLASVNPFALGTNPDLARRAPAYGDAPVYGAAAMPASGSPFTSASAPLPGAAPAYGSAAVPAYGNYGSMAGAMAPSAPGIGQAPGGMAGRTGDPVLDQIQQDLQQLAAETGPRMDFKTTFRNRSGEEGLSELQEIGATAQLSTDFAGGRVSAQAQAVVIDAGRPSGSGLARFGRNATIEAQAIVDQQPSDFVDADTQHASGVALSAGYESNLVSLDAGTTPLGFGNTRFAGGIAVKPRLSPYATGRIWAERRPVTDSVVSYAGTTDPVTGAEWGAVTRTGGGISFSWDRDGTGFYADGSYGRYTGRNVRNNEGVQINGGAYFRAYRDASSQLTLGVNGNYQAFDNNQNYFTFGHGGYFSPQSFLSVSFPIRYTYDRDALEITAGLSPGFQSYEQTGEALYPTDAGAQAALDALKVINSDVRARYDTISQTGFALAADGSAYYEVSPRTRIGGEFQYNSFGVYDEFRTLLGIRQQIGATR
ncbi:cellulose synthase [Altererythrobacter sp. B11]|uniref:cellulose synthase subunit BcsC-related outer membrane protein n=1 Tax=Altererythrobacter sp. B11 TaxID=2060312 RepID=UPI000DC6DC27|nr:cellulose synthase subunit BcsC-related outer membrane protein [Altererythrobacter sp. B11]BBC71895.1 cellulose synthase [Altererythrobacter sp. B11]